MKNRSGEYGVRRGARIAVGALGLGVSLLALGAGIRCQAQSGAETANALDFGPRTVRTAGSAQVSEAARTQVVRVIRDPHSGERWLLLRSFATPAGPGRLVLTSSRQEPAGQRQSGGASGPDPVLVLPVIRAGDRVVVEENSARAEVRLEAVAMGPAANGSNLDVRLKIGGKVVRAVALGPGRAAFAPEAGATP